MNAQAHCEYLAHKIGAKIWTDVNGQHVSLTLFGKPYWTYRNSWVELSSAMSVLADMVDAPKEKI